MTEPRKRSHAKRYGWAIGLAVIGVLVLVARNHAEPREIAHVLENARPAWLLLAVALQLATYPCIAVIWANAIRRSGDSAPPFWNLMRLSVAELFTDQTIPSGGMSGTFLVVSSLEKRGVERRAAMAAVVSSLAGFYIAQLGMVIAAVIILTISNHFGGWEATVSVVAVVAALVIPIPLVVSLAGAMEKLPARIRRIHAIAEVRDAIADAPKEVIFSPRVLVVATLLRLLVLVLDGATLAIGLVAVGSPLLLVHAIAAYMLAYVVGTASFLPGGIGTFEFTSATLLADLGAPFFAAAPATLIMRALSFWLPMVPGVWFAHREVKKPPRHEKRASTA